MLLGCAKTKECYIGIVFQRYFLGRSSALWYRLGWTEDPDRVIVPQVTCPLDTEKLRELRTLFDVRRNSNNFGADIYLEVRSFVYRNALAEFATETA